MNNSKKIVMASLLAIMAVGTTFVFQNCARKNLTATSEELPEKTGKSEGEFVRSNAHVGQLRTTQTQVKEKADELDFLLMHL